MSAEPSSPEPAAASSDDASEDQPERSTTRIALDAMSGDLGVSSALGGAALALARDPSLRLLLFGDAARLSEALGTTPELAERCEIRHCDDVVAMDQTATEALRAGRGSSMWGALDALARGEADTIVSAGNTAALMAMALVRLRTTTGIDRPAIAALWPSLNAAGYNVVLDVGANLKGSERDLVANALMGVAYAKTALGIDRPRVALLNVGVEPTKGLPEIRRAAETLGDDAFQRLSDLRFVGFVEGDEIASDRADVIVADGFSGNVALKSAEGAARLIGDFMREALGASWISRLGAALSARALEALKRRMDPRRVNGGVFLGLNGVVVKSHGGADAVGFASALELAARMGRHDVATVIAQQVANFASAQQIGETGSSNNRAAGS